MIFEILLHITINKPYQSSSNQNVIIHTSNVYRNLKKLNLINCAYIILTLLFTKFPTHNWFERCTTKKKSHNPFFFSKLHNNNTRHDIN